MRSVAALRRKPNDWQNDLALSHPNLICNPSHHRIETLQGSVREVTFLSPLQIMRLESPATSRAARAQLFVRFCNLGCLLVLLLAVATLSTAAKLNWYLPQGDAGHNLTAATKMKVAHAPVILDGLPLQPVIEVAPPLPEIRTSRQIEPEPEIPSISVTVSLQHRSPPSLNT
jgi:hypothetical protein